MLIKSDIIQLAEANNYDAASLQAVIDIESSGYGFDPKNGKIIIQFEPSWFKRTYAEWKRYSAGHTWFYNGVGNQAAEWKAFNSAFAISPRAAMESTSIGLMQVMGFHYLLLGFSEVGLMWDFAKKSELNQLELGLRFIRSNIKLDSALKNQDWSTFAFYYNGSGYKKYNYDTRLKDAYNKAVKVYN